MKRDYVTLEGEWYEIEEDKKKEIVELRKELEKTRSENKGLKKKVTGSENELVRNLEEIKGLKSENERITHGLEMLKYDYEKLKIENVEREIGARREI